jgi:hypothetical protein
VTLQSSYVRHVRAPKLVRGLFALWFLLFGKGPRMWLRLTSLFGLPEEGGAPDDITPDAIICVSIGVILRADAHPLLDEPLPPQLAALLNQLAENDCGLRKGTPRAAARSDARRLNTASTEHAFVTHGRGAPLAQSPCIGTAGRNVDHFAIKPALGARDLPGRPHV